MLMQENTQPEMNDAQGEPPASTSKKSTLIFFVVLEFILLLGIVATGGYAYQQINTHIKSIQQSSASLHKSQNDSAAFSSQYYSMLSQTLDKHQSVLSDINVQLALLKAHTVAGDVAAIKSAQIEYLLRQSKVELDLQHNIPNSLILLEQAQAITEQFNQSNFPHKLNNFEAQLTKTIQQLQAITPVNITALCQKFDALKDEAPHLSLLVSPKPNTTILENTAHFAHKRWYQRAWDNIKASLKELIIIRHHDEKIPALMAPEEQLYLQENLQLLLSRAEWALLQHNAELYQSSLKQAMTWVEKYYVQNSANTLSFYKELQTLSNQNIVIHTPDLSPLILSLQGES
jgi:uroporphyrin-3 C-methyltransferase